MGRHIEKYIDLSELPRNKRGHIDWKQSIYYDVDFIYGDVRSKLKILSYDSKTGFVTIYIDGCSPIDGNCIHRNHLLGVNFSSILNRSVAITHPYTIQYFVDIQDAYKYASGSEKQVELKCPLCGTTRYLSIKKLCTRGFSCQQCSDGISWPEKFMFNILTQLGLDFIKEVTRIKNGFEWVGNYRYDFYFNSGGNGYFVEMDGGFHDKEDVLMSDHKKDQLATEHNIRMIRIDCKYGDTQKRFSYVKNNVLCSALKDIVDLSKIDFNIANYHAAESNLKIASDLWNDGYSVRQIAETICVSDSTVLRYLKNATELSLCDYNNSIAFKRSYKYRPWKIPHNKTLPSRAKPIALYKNDTIVGVFYGGCELERLSKSLYGVCIKRSSISMVLTGKEKTTHGYKIKYITNEEYERLLPQFQTAQNE